MPTYKLNVSTGYAEPMALHDGAALRAMQFVRKSRLVSPPPRAAARSVSPLLPAHIRDITDVVCCVDAMALCMKDSALGG